MTKKKRIKGRATAPPERGHAIYDWDQLRDGEWRQFPTGDVAVFRTAAYQAATRRGMKARTALGSKEGFVKVQFYKG